MDPRRLMEFLDSRPEGLYRIKGYVDFGACDVLNRYAVHAVGRFLRFYPEPWPGDAGDARLTQLVLIGSGIDAPALAKRLEACKSDAPAPHTDDEAGISGMWGVLRFVQDPDGPDPDEPPRPEEPPRDTDGRDSVEPGPGDV
jgi:hypothetical protein